MERLRGKARHSEAQAMNMPGEDIIKLTGLTQKEAEYLSISS